MAPVNPCCSFDVKIGVIIMTVPYAIYSLIEICADSVLVHASLDSKFGESLGFGIFLVPSHTLWITLHWIWDPRKEDNYTTVFIVALTVDLLTFVISVLTFVGALTKVRLLVGAWYLIVPTHLAYVVMLIVKAKKEKIHWPILILLFILVLKAYELWVAQALINQIGAEKRGEIPPNNAQGFNQLQPVQYAYPQPYPAPSEQPPPPYYQQQDQQQQPQQYWQQGQQPPQYFEQSQQLPQSFQQSQQQQPQQYYQQGQQPPQYFQQGQQPPPPLYTPNPPPQLPQA